MSRLRKPAKIKIAEGDRSKQGLAKIGVDLITNGKPTPPDHLTDIEARLWREITWSLPDDLLSQADIGILERHVIAWARFRDCQEKIRKTGLLVQSPQGPIRNPLLVAQNQAAKEMHITGGHLGLSPAARAALSQPLPRKTDPMDYLLGMDEGEQWMPPEMNKRN
jgi:P27 family predicted phage terminase small subunit